MIQTSAVRFGGRSIRKGKPMKVVRNVSACAGMIVFAISTASAQQAIRGTVTGIDEPGGTISIQQTASGTVGTNGTSATDS
jgi:hypothetical protein